MREEKRRILDMSGKLPPSNCHAPRDSETLHKTEDILYLASLLAQGAKMFLQCSSKDRPGYLYYPEGDPLPEGTVIKQRISPRTVRGRFREHFFRYRIGISSPKASGMTFTLEDREIRREGGRGNKAFWTWAERPPHPFSKESDPLVEGLHTLALLNPKQGKRPGKNLFLCPVDGWVVPVLGKATSPAWSWKMLCGREWEHHLCPKCLGSFLQRLTLMN